MELLIPTVLGTESVVRNELRDLGYRDLTLRNGQLLLRGDWSDIERLNRSLQTAERVGIILGRSQAENFDQLFSEIQSFELAQFIPSEGAFPVTARAKRPGFVSDVGLQRMGKKAIAENLLRAHGVTSLPETGANYPLHLIATREEILLTLDTTGPALHKRGYRAETGPAPLKETLAATILHLADWKGDIPLHDPCCGSGTIVIEAALRATRTPPGKDRTFLFQTWSLSGANSMPSTAPNVPSVMISGADRDAKVLLHARENAARAGVSEFVQFAETPLSSNPIQGAILLTNPPYGERLSADLKVLYREFRALLERNRELHLLTPDRSVENSLGRKANSRRKLSNGGMEVTLYSWRKG